MSKHYIGEIGTRIIVKADSDISSASGVFLYVQKPNSSVETWSGTIESGVYITHIVQAGEFDQTGTYSVQPWVAMSGWSGYGETDEFKVYKRFC